MERFLFRPFAIGLLICLVSIASGCSKNSETKGVEEKIVNVRTEEVEKRSLRPFIETIGTLYPYETVEISAEIDGILKDVRVEEGTIVARGDLLAAIDESDYELQVRHAEAVLRQAETSLSNAIVEFRRKEPLYKEGLLSKEEFDAVSTRLSLAEAEVDKAKASLSLMQQRLYKTKIYSPLSGVVKEKRVSPGNFIKTGTPLFTVIQTNPIKLLFQISEKDAGRLKVGEEVLCKVDPYPEKEFKGKLNIINPSLDETTRTLKVEALIPNREGLLKPGLFARVILYTGSPRSTLVVPATALLYEAEKVKVFTIEEGRAKERIIKTGDKYNDMFAVLEGLKEGDKVVVTGQQNLSEGTKVRNHVAR